MPTLLRDATPDDAGACAAIYAPYVAETTVSFETDPPDAGEMARRIAAAQERHAWIVAEAGTVVGYAYGGPWRSRAAYAATCEVSVYLAPAARGAGLGRLLYAELLDRMRVAGMHVAVGGATTPNPASEALHRALGFEVVGTFREVGRKHGAWRDVRWYQRTL